MLDEHEFVKIEKDLKKSEEKREEVIKLSREIIQLSKQIIYSLHREDKNSAEAILSHIKQKKQKLPEETYDAGIQMVAIQEYVEALCFYDFMVHNKMPTRDDLKVDTESYLMGLCDLTGELMRKAVKQVIEQKYDEAAKIKALVEELYGAFLKFDLRNGELRKKSDSIKWNLQKLEDLMCDIAIRRK
jgi:predicted translin family RNA/ssDNA-binding protein